jgi:predicted DsbA family dithiol-disulfide isomerase
MFPLHPDTPDKGITLETLFAGRLMDMDLMKAQLKQAADRLGLPFGNRTMSYNSRLAQELGKWSESKGKGDSFHEAVFRAYFADGKNISNISVLLEIAKTVGLPESEAEKILHNRAYKDAVDADWSRAGLLGVTAVPTFCLNERHLVGAQPYTVLEQFLSENSIQRRKK